MWDEHSVEYVNPFSDATPDSMGMDDNDVIAVLPMQTGGCIASPVPAKFGNCAGT